MGIPKFDFRYCVVGGAAEKVRRCQATHRQVGVVRVKQRDLRRDRTTQRHIIQKNIKKQRQGVRGRDITKKTGKIRMPLKERQHRVIGIVDNACRDRQRDRMQSTV